MINDDESIEENNVSDELFNSHVSDNCLNVITDKDLKVWIYLNVKELDKRGKVFKCLGNPVTCYGKRSAIDLDSDEITQVKNWTMISNFHKKLQLYFN